MEIVTGYLQSYDWGPTDGLKTWTQSTGGPQAELWFGSHVNGPSPLRDAEGFATTELTILTKILAAARPLSIQIHPPAELAAQMFDREEADPTVQRLVSDRYGKAELLIAFEPFIILEGFRDPAETAKAFAQLGGRMETVTGALEEGDLARAIKLLLTMSPEDVEAMAPALPEAFAASGASEHTVDTSAEVVAAFPGDPGVFVAALLKARTLEPGQAVYVDPGTVHAYVRGLGLEVMTNSDNVLRLGLTSKTVAVEAALEALDLTAQPHPFDAEEVEGIISYAPPGAPFSVEVVRSATCKARTGHSRVIVCLEGTVAVGDATLALGEGALLDDAEATVEVKVDGVAIIAHHANAETSMSA